MIDTSVFPPPLAPSHAIRTKVQLDAYRTSLPFGESPGDALHRGVTGLSCVSCSAARSWSLADDARGQPPGNLPVQHKGRYVS